MDILPKIRRNSAIVKLRLVIAARSFDSSQADLIVALLHLQTGTYGWEVVGRPGRRLDNDTAGSLPRFGRVDSFMAT